MHAFSSPFFFFNIFFFFLFAIGSKKKRRKKLHSPKSVFSISFLLLHHSNSNRDLFTYVLLHIHYVYLFSYIIDVHKKSILLLRCQTDKYAFATEELIEKLFYTFLRTSIRLSCPRYTLLRLNARTNVSILDMMLMSLLIRFYARFIRVDRNCVPVMTITSVSWTNSFQYFTKNENYFRHNDTKINFYDRVNERSEKELIEKRH